MSKRILLLDDENRFADAVMEALTEHGYDVTTVSEGKMALMLLEEQHFDLVISDVIMPEMDGVELAFKLLRSFPDQRFVMMTGGGRISRDYYIEVLRTLGVKHWLTKPFTIRRLLHVIRLCLNDQPMDDEENVKRTDNLDGWI